jgi:hypothetical protein
MTAELSSADLGSAFVFLAIVLAWVWVAWKSGCGRNASSPGKPGYRHFVD